MTTAGPPSAPSPVEPGRSASREGEVGSDDLPPDAASALDIIRAQRLAIRDRFELDTRVLFGAWGAAWLLGNLVLFSTAQP